MFTDELKLIKEAEARADEIRRQAKLSAKELVQESDNEAHRLIDEAFAKERQQCQAIIKEGQDIAQEKYDKAMKKAEEFCENMAAKAVKHQDDAVKFIAERIVESSVNR